MAFQMVRSFFGQRSPSRSRVHEPIIDSESFGNQRGKAHYDIRDVGKFANSNWFELAWHDKEASELGRKPHNCRNIYFSLLHSAGGVHYKQMQNDGLLPRDQQDEI